MDGTSFSTQEGGSTVNLVTSYSREYETVVTRTVESNKSKAPNGEVPQFSQVPIVSLIHFVER